VRASVLQRLPRDESRARLPGSGRVTVLYPWLTVGTGAGAASGAGVGSMRVTGGGVGLGASAGETSEAPGGADFDLAGGLSFDFFVALACARRDRWSSFFLAAT